MDPIEHSRSSKRLVFQITSLSSVAKCCFYHTWYRQVSTFKIVGLIPDT